MRRLAVMLLLLGFAPSMWANSSGAPAQVSGAPGEGNCSACHGGTPNSGPGSLQVRFDGVMNWTPGQPVKVLGLLVPVSLGGCPPYTSGLSTRCSTWGLTKKLVGNLILGWASRLDAFSAYPLRT